MPQAVPLVVGAAAGWTAAATIPAAIMSASTAFALASTAGSMIVGTIQANNQRRKAERQARAAYEATLKDRAVMARSAVEPRRVVYGNCVISGPITFMETIGGKAVPKK
jgi:uncharacterized membrane protein YfcA